MELNFERGEERRREIRQPPAEHYNKIRLLFSRVCSEALFVPIRSMQYLAIVDREEIVFIDGQGPRRIELAWRDFQTGEREDLREPVAYSCIYYDDNGRENMNRLQSEFFKALELMQDRQPKAGGATIIPLEKR